MPIQKVTSKSGKTYYQYNNMTRYYFNTPNTEIKAKQQAINQARAIKIKEAFLNQNLFIHDEEYLGDRKSEKILSDI
jgi:hypothetical protein